MTREILPIRSRRTERVKRVTTVQHAFAAFILITTAYGHLTDAKHHNVVLPVLEILAAAGLFFAVVVEKVRKTHPRVGWLEIAGGIMTGVEAVAKLREPHHLLFYILSFVSPVILILLGIFDTRLQQGLKLEANDDAFEARLRIAWKHRVKWAGLKSYRITPTHIEFTRENGAIKRIKVKDLYDRENAMAWAEEQFRMRGLAADPQTAPPSSAS